MNEFEEIEVIDLNIYIKNKPACQLSNVSRISQNILKLKEKYGCFDHDTNAKLFKKHEKPRVAGKYSDVWKSPKEDGKVFKKIENSEFNDKRFLIACVNKVSSNNVKKITDKMIRHVNISDGSKQKDILEYIINKACAEPGYLEQYNHIIQHTYKSNEIQEAIRTSTLDRTWLRKTIDTCMLPQSSWDFTVHKQKLLKKNQAHVFWIKNNYITQLEYIKFLFDNIESKEVSLLVDMLHEFYRQDKSKIPKEYKSLNMFKNVENKKTVFQLQEIFE